MKNLNFKNLTGFVALFFLAFLMACGTTETSQTDLLAKQWVYDEVEFAGQTMSGEALGSPVMHFKADGTYTMEFGGMEENGTWKIEGDKLITYGGDEMDQEQELTIIELTAEALILEGEAEGTTMKVSMIPLPL